MYKKTFKLCLFSIKQRNVLFVWWWICLKIFETKVFSHQTNTLFHLGSISSTFAPYFYASRFTPTFIGVKRRAQKLGVERKAQKILVKFNGKVGPWLAINVSEIEVEQQRKCKRKSCTYTCWWNWPLMYNVNNASNGAWKTNSFLTEI